MMQPQSIRRPQKGAAARAASIVALGGFVLVVSCAKGTSEGRSGGSGTDRAPAGTSSTPASSPATNPPSAANPSTVTPPPTGRMAAPPPGQEGRVTLVEPRDVEGLMISVPARWGTVEPKSAMRKAEYLLPGAGGDGSMAVFYFGAGQGGPATANLERWVGQFEGASGGPAAAEHTESAANNVTIRTVSVSGTMLPSSMSGETEKKPGWKMIASVVEGPGGPWFLKATGPAATIDAERAGYEAMLAALRSSK